MRWSSPSSCSAVTTHGVHAFVVRIRDDEGPADAGRADRGLRPQDRPQRRRQRPDLVRRGADRAHRPARPLRRGHRRRPLLLRHRERQPTLLHHARHARPGPGVRGRRRHQRLEGGAGPRDRVRPPPSPVRQPGLRDRGGAARLRHAPAPAVPAAGPHLRPALRAGARRGRPARGVQQHRGRGGRGARPPLARVAGRRHEGARHLARVPDDPGVPRGLRRRRLPVGQPVRRAAGPTPTCSPPSRATTRS